ncbi:MAG TPA: YkgJ family cysteine cluster protein [Porticoccaceae bacterium]|nr:YkgJ family cysteine cluster protein [Verrucomicrobiales bacterium]HIL59995.1 YkgJ family cysteine cluster protein [Porticoccaceae bacterium]
MQTATIKYKCDRCGNCCQWPGEVPLSQSEISKMSKNLGCSENEFIQNFTKLRQSRSGLTLSEKSDGSCIFLEGNSCKVHRSKPKQCRDFPNKWRFPGWRQICEATPQRTDISKLK